MRTIREKTPPTDPSTTAGFPEVGGVVGYPSDVQASSTFSAVSVSAQSW